MNFIYVFIYVHVPVDSKFHPQGCGLRKIKSPKVSNCEILGAHWHLSLYEKSKFFLVTQRQKLVACQCGTQMLLEHKSIYLVINN